MGGMPPGMMGGMGGGQRGGRPKPEQPNELPSGSMVFVRGLQGAAQHNGKRGTVESFDSSVGR